ncbi:hypothetical protein T03_1265 [Trichinella britovi]|uniref:Uncharacterized protein n=1 Tax=Trichinella britovi TaxID=45882 RepID=A0A0V1C3T7_TRIBR|nr:hypothetical protein T03_1265 [Trichinella britovi]
MHLVFLAHVDVRKQTSLYTLVHQVVCPLIVSVNAFSKSSATIQQGSAAAGCNQAHYVRHKPTYQPTVEYEHADVSIAD